MLYNKHCKNRFVFQVIVTLFVRFDNNNEAWEWREKFCFIKLFAKKSYNKIVQCDLLCKSCARFIKLRKNILLF